MKVYFMRIFHVSDMTDIDISVLPEAFQAAGYPDVFSFPTFAYKKSGSREDKRAHSIPLHFDASSSLDQ
jgi:hypothetical protein